MARETGLGTGRGTDAGGGVETGSVSPVTAGAGCGGAPEGMLGTAVAGVTDSGFPAVRSSCSTRSHSPARSVSRRRTVSLRSSLDSMSPPPLPVRGDTCIYGSVMVMESEWQGESVEEGGERNSGIQLLPGAGSPGQSPRAGPKDYGPRTVLPGMPFFRVVCHAAVGMFLGLCSPPPSPRG